jgi:uncharacterized membrane protein YkvA (DUF1232 family)
MDLVWDAVTAIAVLAVGWLVLVALIWLHRPSRDLAGPALHLIPDLVRLVRGLMADAATPLGVRMALGGLLVYLVSPVDLIPDFLPGVGSLDDLVITALVLRWAGRRVGIDDLRAKWTGDPAGFDVLRRLLGLREPQ